MKTERIFRTSHGIYRVSITDVIDGKVRVNESLRLKSGGDRTKNKISEGQGDYLRKALKTMTKEMAEDRSLDLSKMIGGG